MKKLLQSLRSSEPEMPWGMTKFGGQEANWRKVVPVTVGAIAIAIAAALTKPEAEDVELFFDKAKATADQAPDPPPEKKDIPSLEQLVEALNVPDGYRIEIVPGGEMVNPISINFGPDGKSMDVLQSTEYPEVPEQDSDSRDLVHRFTDTDSNGTFESNGVYLDEVRIPTSAVRYKGNTILFSIPHIQTVADEDGDGILERKKLLDGDADFNDTHGMVGAMHYAPDGWVYACHGFQNDSTFRASDGTEVHLEEGSLFRFRPDGSRVEKLTQGPTNPHGIEWTERGDILFSDSESREVQALVTNGYYKGFGTQPHDGTGYVQPIMMHGHDSSSTSGIAFRQTTTDLGDKETFVLTCNPTKGSINHDRIEYVGSTPKLEKQEPFLSLKDQNPGEFQFWPVDVKVAPDGSIYVVAFRAEAITHSTKENEQPAYRYKGCILRLVPTDGEQDTTDAPPDLTELSAEQLVEHLGNQNSGIRTMAMHEMVDRCGNAAIVHAHNCLRDTSNSPLQRSSSIWVLQRLGHIQPVLDAAGDNDPLVRTHAIKALAELSPEQWNDSTKKIALTALHDDDPFVRRAGAEALGKHRSHDTIAPLLELWNDPERTVEGDTLLSQTIKITLRDTIAELPQQETQKLITQLIDQGLNVDNISDVCRGIHSAQSAEMLLEHFENAPTDDIPGFIDTKKIDFDEQQFPPSKADLIQHLARYGTEEMNDRMWKVLESMQGEENEAQILLALHRGLASRVQDAGKDAKAPELPAGIARWASSIAHTLLHDRSDKKHEKIELGLRVVRNLRLQRNFDRVFDLASPNMPLEKLWGHAMSAGLALDTDRVSRILIGFLTDHAEEKEYSNKVYRQRAARALGSVDSDHCREALLHLLPQSPRIEIDLAVGLCRSDRGAEQLVQFCLHNSTYRKILENAEVQSVLRVRLRTSSTPSTTIALGLANTVVGTRVLVETAAELPAVRPLLENPEVKKLLEKNGLSRRSAENRKIQALARSFDARKSALSRDGGAEIFKANCAGCHMIEDGHKAMVGPNLNSVRHGWPASKVLEAVLYPSRELSTGFEPMIVMTVTGEVITGTVESETASSITLLVPSYQNGVYGKKDRVIPRDEIEEMQKPKTSIMPDGFEGLGDEQLLDLLKFIKSK